MCPFQDGDPLRQLEEKMQEIARRLRELDRCCGEASVLLERLAEERASQSSLEERQGALLVGLTLRGGTMDASAFSALAFDLGVAPGALEALFRGPDPYLIHRAGGAPGITERGLESAANWRPRLPDELFRAATDV